MDKEETLREQEKKILDMLCRFGRKEIAEILGISLHSVNSHLVKLERLGLYSETNNLLKNSFKQ